MRVLLGMSGGVDSAVAAVLLKNNGYSVVGCTLALCKNDEQNQLEARNICVQLGINHVVLDYKKFFLNTVIRNFGQEYKYGNTPNPCIVCNKHIKFGAMYEYAMQNNFDYIATGHYAGIKNINNHLYLCKAVDLNKDQSYMLYNLSEEMLPHILFPLSDYSKDEIRIIAESYNLNIAHKKDSQDICFIPDGDYVSFLNNELNISCDKGKYIDEQGKFLGENEGILSYTIGQRKGLNISLGKYAYVLKKSAQNNTVTLTTDESKLFKATVHLKNINLINTVNNNKIQVTAKLRYRHKGDSAILTIYDDNTGILEFTTPQRAPSPGQSAVFYNEDIVIGGGIIQA